MTSSIGYGQFCPVAMASEVLCTRWTILLLREMFAGSTRFNELRKGVPRMSPTLLSKRLKELETAGIIRHMADDAGAGKYELTPAGADLKPIVLSIGNWGQRWMETETSLRNLDPSLLMWDMRRNLKPAPLPPRRCVIQFVYPELTRARQNWWLVVDAGEVDLCSVEPGFDVDLYVRTGLRTMTEIWMGLTTVQAETGAGRLHLQGDAAVRRSIQQWLGLSVFAAERKLATA